MINTIAPSIILFFRSARMEQCIRNFQNIQFEDGSRVIWLVQRSVADALTQQLNLSADDLLMIDQPTFCDAELESSIGEQIKSLKIAKAYVPVNNPDGSGYSSILRFLSRYGITTIFIYPDVYPVRQEQIDYSSYRIRNIGDAIMIRLERLIMAILHIFGLPILVMLLIFGRRNRFLRKQYGLPLWKSKMKNDDRPAYIYPLY